VVAVVVLHYATDFTGTLERRFYDFASTSNSRQPSDRVAVIAIDDQSIANIGRWPWSREVHAQLIDKLAAAKAKTIVNTVFFFEPQTDRGLVFIRKMKEALAPGAGQGGLSDQLGKVIAEAEEALDTDAKLAASMNKAGNVLVPSVFQLGEPQGKPDRPLPPYALKSALDESSGFSVPAIKGQQPLEAIGVAAAGIGIGQIEPVDKAAARTRHIDAAALEPKPASDERSGAGQQVIGRRCCQQQQVDPLAREAGSGQRALAGCNRKIGERLIVGHVAARLDAGALLDPARGETKALLDLRVGDAPIGDVVTEPYDFSSAHAATSPTASRMTLYTVCSSPAVMQ
jgi:hypothetical protein